MALRPEMFKLYTTSSLDLYIPRKGYNVLTLVEGAESASSYIKRISLKGNIPYAYSPKFLKVFNKMLITNPKELKQSYGKDFKVAFNLKMLQSKSFFYDLTPYIYYLKDRLDSQRYYREAIKTINQQVERVQQDSENETIMIYIIDNEILNTKTIEKDLYIYFLLKGLKESQNDLNLNVSKIFITSTDSNKFYMIYDREETKNNYGKVFNIVKRFMKDVEIVIELPEDSLSSGAIKDPSEEMVKKAVHDIVKSNEKIIKDKKLSLDTVKSRVDAYVMSDKEMQTFAVDTYQTNDNLKGQSIIFGSFANDEEPMLGVMDSSDKDLENVHEQEKIADEEGLTNTQSVDKIISKDIPESYLKSNASHAIARRSNYHTHLTKVIQDSIELPLSEIGYRVMDVKFKESKSNDAEIYKTETESVIIKCKDPDGKTVNLKFEVPKLIENRYILSGGIKWFYPTILSTFPIFVVQPHKVQFRTNYSSITYHHALVNKREDIRCYIGGFKLPFSMLLSALLSIEGLLKNYDINYIITDSKVRNAQLEQLVFGNGQVLQIQREDGNSIKRCIINGIKIMFSKYNFKTLTDSDEVFECIKQYTKVNRSEYILRQVFKYIVDVQTKEVLESRKISSSLKDICTYCANLAVSGVMEDKLSVHNVYLRTTDIIAAGVEKGVHNAISVYKQKHVYQPTSSLSNDVAFVFKFFRDEGVLKMLQQQTPVEEVASYTSVSIVGPGGLPNKDAAVARDRNVRPDHFGNMCPIDTSEGDPGITLYVTSGHVYDEEKHSFMPMKYNPDNKNILGVSPSLTPFVECDDNVRANMASNQSRQAVPIITSQIPYVCTGYESYIPAMTSSIFNKKAAKDGEILHIDENVIIVEYKDGTKESLDIRPAQLKSGSGMSSALTYTPIYKTGDKFKAHSILAYNQYIQPVLSQGINAKCAYMTYQGYNYEDGLVISETFANTLVSIHHESIDLNLTDNDIIDSFPKIGQEFETGDLVVKIHRNVIGGEDLSEAEEVFAPSKIKIVDIEVYPTNSEKFKDILNDVDKHYSTTNDALKTYGLSKMFDKKKVIDNEGKYTEHRELLKVSKIIIKIVRYMPADIGDKLTNRHAAKVRTSIL